MWGNPNDGREASAQRHSEEAWMVSEGLAAKGVMHVEAVGRGEERQTRLGDTRRERPVRELVGLDERIDRELVGIEEVA